MLAAHEEIRGAVEYHHSEGLVETRDRWMLGGVLDLAQLDVSEVMVHRKAIALLDADLPPRELIAAALESAAQPPAALSRRARRTSSACCTSRTCCRRWPTPTATWTRSTSPIMREPWFVPETTSLKDQLAAFLKREIPLRPGGRRVRRAAGLVTLEDILEEIVGEIEDEYDVDVSDVKPQPDGSVSVDGSVTIRDLNRAMDWDLPDDEAVTVAGLLIHEAQTIPQVGQTFSFYGHRFRVTGRKGNQITRLEISPEPGARG